MNAAEIRDKFLQYFADRDHKIVDSSPLVPQDDPTLLFVNAGMVQFKRIFTGEERPDYGKVVTCQRCVRAGGKHNDLENVGYTARHHTFFEMLGNFSFGDYFKKEAIAYSWEFLTGVIGLSPQNLWVSVYEEDDEAYRLWEKIDDLPPGRIVRLGAKENFWAMGDTGPCGPCSEIHVDLGEEAGCGHADCTVGCDCGRFLELWNLVFMEYEQKEDGFRVPLPKPCIDTGMGLERIAALAQGGLTNYDSDLFRGLFTTLAQMSGKKYGDSREVNTAMRVIADHGRGTAFLIADGVLPANEGRGYVLRRIMRRAVRFGRSLELGEGFLAEICRLVVREMSGAWPHLHSAAGLMDKVVGREENSFRETLDYGLEKLQAELDRLQEKGENLISGDFMFKLYDTYGFPVDIVRDVALEKGFILDEDGFNQAMEEQRARSRSSWKSSDIEAREEGVRKLAANGERSEFAGYNDLYLTADIKAVMDGNGELLNEAGQGQDVLIISSATPFYPEAGGQVGDQGEIISQSGKARVYDTVKIGESLIGHKAEIVSGFLSEGSPAEFRVDEESRWATEANHSATHLLHAALIEILGEHVKQSGSLVTPERLRFDFVHFAPLTPEELKEVENRVNREIRRNTSLDKAVFSKEEALEAGATALFGEKYGETVRVVSIPDYSKELCGGTHVEATGEIGAFKIISETGIAAGIRRIEAVTGEQALFLFQRSMERLEELSELMKTTPENLKEKVAGLLDKQRELERQVARLSEELSLADLDRMIEESPEVKGVKVFTRELSLDSAKTLREVGDKVRNKLGSGVAVLGGVFNGKVSLLVIVSHDLTDKLHAGKIVNEVAALVGGKGGGRPDMAQAGGVMTDKLRDALKAAEGIVEKFL
ncbi:MAG: alanine--tRNA ligase [Desulfurivibrionaceae bacterium]